GPCRAPALGIAGGLEEHGGADRSGKNQDQGRHAHESDPVALFQGPVDFALGFLFMLVLALVPGFLAFSHADFELEHAAFEIGFERYYGVPLELGGFFHLYDFGPASQQLALPAGEVVVDIAPGIFVDIGVDQPDFVLFHDDEGFRQFQFSRPHGFDLRALEGYAHLPYIQNMVMVAGGSVQDF